MTPEHAFSSPKLEALRQELVAGNRSALDTFWQELGQQETPIIESLAGDETHSLATFIWRGSDEDQEVAVVSTLSEGDEPDAMTHIPGTDLWYKTYKVHEELRESYQFAVAGENIADPLNPHKHVFPGDEEIGFTGWVSSVIEMPKAPSQPWSSERPNVRHGQVTPHRINSEILDNEYRVWIYTPPDYKADGEPYGFLLILDGWFYLELVPAPTILDNLLADSLTPPLVAIMVGDVFGETRGRDLSCYPPFADFLTGELLPWAKRNYNLSDNPAQNTVAGISLGGLMAAYMGLRHSDVFGNVISQSGAFWYKPEGEHEEEWLARQYALTPKLPLRFYLDVGLLETDMDPGDLTCMLSRNRHMRDVLQAKGYPVYYSEFYGGHNPMNWKGTFANGILALLGIAT
ncbi:MAG TPA: alpha/beta hydrolase-fold protein [Anaerolineae bacterium]|jgi:enterochelin esterase family protein|nr:alpha/beta hydrolase-fold protein [Anaerolineae bacterium]